MKNEKKLVSIVIPCINEEKNINRTLDGLLELISGHKYAFEIIVIEDGSKDNTWKVIEDYCQKYANIIGLKQMTNFGQSAAYQAGFDVSKGDYVLTVSADLEIPFKYINDIIKHLDEGYDFVNTNRMARWGRRGGLGRAGKSGIANKIIDSIAGVNIKDTGSGMKGFTRLLIDNLRLYGEMHRYMPAYLSVYGAKIIEIDVEFKDRDYGVSYYKGFGDINRTIKVILDLVTLAFMVRFAKRPFTFMPGRLFGFTGAVFTGVGSLAGLYLLIIKLLGESIGGRPLFIVAVMMIVIGIQLMMTGMLGELMMRTYFESSGRTTYVVRKRLN